MLGEVARQHVGLVAQPRQPRPAAGQALRALLRARPGMRVLGGIAAIDPRQPLLRRHRERGARVGVQPRRRRAPGLDPERVLDVRRHPADRERLRPAGDALELGGRQPEDLAELADRPARAEGREGRHQRRVLAPVAVVHARDQDLADVAREVEVDVRQRRQLLVEEAPEEQLVGDRVDVREAGEVADDRGHRGAAAAPRRQQRARRVGPAHLDGDLARELEHVAVQEEEAGQAERVDHPQLLLQARARRGAVRVAGRVALLEALRAQLGERAVGLRVIRAGVAVAEVLAEIEGQAVGERARLGDRARVVLEARRHRLRRGEHMGEVAAAHGLRGVERGVVAQRDEGVLQRRPRAGVRVDVARRHGRHAEALRQLGEAAVAGAVVAVEGPLELDPQVVGAEDPQQPPQARLVVDALARAAAQADEPGGVLLERGERDLRGRLGLVAVVLVRDRDDPAEVAPAGRVLDQQRDVAAVLQRHLRPVDRAQPEARRRTARTPSTRTGRRGR